MSSEACPRGYRYYSCRSNDFSGCCPVDPCSLATCPSSSLLPDQSREDPMTTSDTEASPARTTSSSPATKTDSGVTHTIPNNSVVTVTKHTVVFSEAPLPTESPSSSPDITSEAAALTASCSSCAPTPTFSSPPSTDGSAEGGLPTGAVAGAATGGAVIVIIILIIVFVLRCRKRKRGGSDASETEALGRDSRLNGSEKLTSSQAGHLRPSSDPFAPFGGRADQPEELHRPPSGIFEMDGAGISPVELPVFSISEAPGADMVKGPSSEGPFETGTTAADPAATLAAPTSPRGETTYVNQWNQYKALAAGSNSNEKRNGGTVL